MVSQIAYPTQFVASCDSNTARGFPYHKSHHTHHHAPSNLVPNSIGSGPILFGTAIVRCSPLAGESLTLASMLAACRRESHVGFYAKPGITNKMLAACRRESHVGFYAKPGTASQMLAACRRKSHVRGDLVERRGAAAN